MFSSKWRSLILRHFFVEELDMIIELLTYYPGFRLTVLRTGVRPDLKFREYRSGQSQQ
jgi:hypothetical protein